MKDKHAFIVRVTTDGKISPNLAAKKIREALGGQKVWYGEPKERTSVAVVKITVSRWG